VRQDLNFSTHSADYCSVTVTDDLIQRELMLNRFKRLIGELICGEIARNSFHPWEIEILLDMDSCQLEPRRRVDILRQYQRAVERQLESGPGPPIKLSEFLIVRQRRRDADSKSPSEPC
jgi:hypothetical protein